MFSSSSSLDAHLIPPPSESNFSADITHGVFNVLSSSDSYSAPFRLGHFNTAIFFGVYLEISFLFLYRLKKHDRNRKIIYALILIPFGLTTLILLTVPFFRSIASQGSNFLFEPYLMRSIAQFSYLWASLLILMAITRLVRPVNGSLIHAALLSMLLTIAFIGIYLRDSSDAYSMTPRYSYCGASACLTHSDIDVINFISRQYKKYREEVPHPTFQEIPKILIPNHGYIQGQEKLLMPVGGTRVLPSWETYPLAFFYWQGSDEYTYDNYEKRICKHLDLEWLKARNIKFIFIPEENRATCVKGMKYLFNEKTPYLSKWRSCF